MLAVTHNSRVWLLWFMPREFNNTDPAIELAGLQRARNEPRTAAQGKDGNTRKLSVAAFSAGYGGELARLQPTEQATRDELGRRRAERAI